MLIISCTASSSCLLAVWAKVGWDPIMESSALTPSPIPRFVFSFGKFYSSTTNLHIQRNLTILALTELCMFSASLLAFWKVNEWICVLQPVIIKDLGWLVLNTLYFRSWFKLLLILYLQPVMIKDLGWLGETVGKFR